MERIRILLVDGEAQPRLAEISRPGAGADSDPAQERANLVRGGGDGTGWVGCSRLRTWRREPERPARLPERVPPPPRGSSGLTCCRICPRRRPPLPETDEESAGRQPRHTAPAAVTLAAARGGDGGGGVGAGNCFLQDSRSFDVKEKNKKIKHGQTLSTERRWAA